jgi:predicted  nucleic acid-binding Zn-ribbon protein
MEKITPIAEQLKSLFNLQLVDTRLDKIKNIRGELPIEVHDLEDDIIGLETRLENIDNAVEDLKKDIEANKTKISEANTLLLKYESQQIHVKNNREYVAISKEMELQKLEVMASEKKIKEVKSDIDDKGKQKELTKTDLEEKKNDLVAKEKELKDIIGETEKEESEIVESRGKAEEKIEERLVKAYSKIRDTYKNGQAIVAIDRDACGGCFSQVPPQRQLDVRLHMKIIVCENCGRILIDSSLANDVSEEMTSIPKKKS